MLLMHFLCCGIDWEWPGSAEQAKLLLGIETDQPLSDAFLRGIYVTILRIVFIHTSFARKMFVSQGALAGKRDKLRRKQRGEAPKKLKPEVEQLEERKRPASVPLEDTITTQTPLEIEQTASEDVNLDTLMQAIRTDPSFANKVRDLLSEEGSNDNTAENESASSSAEKAEDEGSVKNLKKKEEAQEQEGSIKSFRKRKKSNVTASIRDPVKVTDMSTKQEDGSSTGFSIGHEARDVVNIGNAYKSEVDSLTPEQWRQKFQFDVIQKQQPLAWWEKQCDERDRPRAMVSFSYKT